MLLEPQNKLKLWDSFHLSGEFVLTFHCFFKTLNLSYYTLKEFIHHYGNFAGNSIFIFVSIIALKILLFIYFSFYLFLIFIYFLL
jgi:hypothetical protein